MNGIRRLLRITRTREGITRAVEDELRFHFEMTMRELMAGGMTPEDARKETERRFGDVERTRDKLAAIDRALAGQEQRAEWWSAFGQDLRYALRGLRLKPGFGAAVIITLGLGIGANATMFGIVDRLLFRPPNLLIAPDLSGRFYLGKTFRGKENVASYMGYRRFLDLKGKTTSFDAMTPYYTRKLAVGTGDATREMTVAVSDPDLWRMFDVKPVIGRFYDASDNDPRNPTDVFVVSYAYWQMQYGGRKDVLGATTQLGSKKYTVIGVAPEGFNGFNSEPTIGFTPIAAAASTMGNPKNPWYSTYNMTWFESFGRRKPGVSLAVANADLSHAHEASYKTQLEAQPQNTPLALVKPRGLIGPVLKDRGPNVGNDAKVASWLGGVALIVLLIACANVANLLLARALRRRREIAVRIALGVSRGRLLMQLATESFLLAALGGVAGLATAHWGGAVMRRALLDQTATMATFTDPRILMFVAALTVIAGLITGFVPLLQTGRTDITSTLKAGVREGNVHRSKVGVGLLVAQAAFSVVLLVGAGLFMRSLFNVQHVKLGYDADQLLNVDITWRGVTVDSLRQVAIRDELVARAKTVPGVENAARALTVPFWSTWQFTLFVAGIDSVDKLGDFTLQSGSPELLKTMGTRIVRGRDISAEDREHAPRAMVVNEAMAKKLWPGQDPIGKCVRINADTMPCSTVVGVAEDVRRGSLAEPEMHYYLSIDQFQRSNGGVFIRTTGPAAEKMEAVRRALQSVMPGASYVNVTPMSTVMAPTVRSWKLGATMFAVFGGLALVLAAIGLYSVIAYNVTQRMHEMGVRVALGAQRRNVITLIVREGLWIVLPGIALGTVAAIIAGKWIKPLLFNVSPGDPPVLIGVVATLVTVAVAASWIPALRAARVDPNEALRSD